MGDDWQSLILSFFLGLIFSFFLAKLISIVVTFKDDNLTITRSRSSNDHSSNLIEPDVKFGNAVSGPNRSGSRSGAEVGETRETDSVMDEQGSVRNENMNRGSDNYDDDDDDDDDWEGVECTELEDTFSAASAFVATAAADRLSQKVSTDVQLQLYGLYKIATEGPCTAPQPSALKMTARAKWYSVVL